MYTEVIVDCRYGVKIVTYWVYTCGSGVLWLTFVSIGTGSWARVESGAVRCKFLLTLAVPDSTRAQLWLIFGSHPVELIRYSPLTHLYLCKSFEEHVRPIRFLRV